MLEMSKIFNKNKNKSWERLLYLRFSNRTVKSRFQFFIYLVGNQQCQDNEGLNLIQLATVSSCVYFQTETRATFDTVITTNLIGRKLPLTEIPSMERGRKWKCHNQLHEA